jgi:hypothetical protein
VKPSAAAAHVVLALALIPFSAQAELIEMVWDGEQRFSRQVELAPARFVEVCGKLSANEAVAWQFEATGSLDFNVHYHQGKEVRFPAKQEGVARLQGELEVDVDQNYCWMWTNKTRTPVRLSLALKKR